MQHKKTLGVWTLTALVAGNMIGSGIFLLPASLASFGTISIGAWIFTALGALALALVFANLSRHSPQVGGPYAYCREAFGDFIGFEVAYNYWIMQWVGNAAISVALVSYATVFFPILAHNNQLAFLVAVCAVWFVTVINIIGVKQAGILQLITTVLKVLPLIVISIAGLFYLKLDNLSAFNISGTSDFTALSSCAALTLWAFIGLESATVPAEDIKDPHKTIPRATILGTLLTAVIYITSTVALMGMIPVSVLAGSSAPYADAANIIFGTLGRDLVGLGAIISCLGALNGWALLGGQVAMAASRNKLFPPAFARETKNGTPYFGLTVSACLITVLLYMNYQSSLVEQFTFIISLAVFATLIPYIMTTMAELILFIRDREKFNGQRLTRSTIIALIAFAYTFWAVIGSGEAIVFDGMLLFLSGIPVYVWMKWREAEYA